MELFSISSRICPLVRYEPSSLLSCRAHQLGTSLLTREVWLTSCLTGLDLTKYYVKLLLIQLKQSSVKSKQKQDVIRTVIFPLMLVFSELA